MTDSATSGLEQLETLAHVVRDLTVAHGEERALADVTTLLSGWDPSEVVSVLAAAALAHSRWIDEDDVTLQRDNC